MGELEKPGFNEFADRVHAMQERGVLRPLLEDLNPQVLEDYDIQKPNHAVIMERLRQAGVTKRVRKHIDSRIADTAFVKEVRRFAKCQEAKGGEEAWCLVLSSDKGAGKTIAAAVWLYDMMMDLGRDTKETYWWPASKLSTISSFGPSGYEQMMGVPYLVIDDLGMEYADKNGNMLARLDAILDHRYSNFLPTVITTNQNKEAFKIRFGMRIYDRIREGYSAGGRFFMSTEKSLRGEHARVHIREEIPAANIGEANQPEERPSVHLREGQAEDVSGEEVEGLSQDGYSSAQEAVGR